ncbi:chemotaxis protein CheY [Marichromatium purpuratum 984]|uniref:diguanylate cyclase n=1 Tax=Marichromatium purpuratum 984 TaxID=765910 RepID=W0E0V9_MARPU|nr:chemotaxis protein CheY [Marichromatium purpuratum 984]
MEQRERDIGSQAERIRALNAELRIEAVTDKLTGLYNARFFWERIADCFEHHHRSGEPFTFAILDIDHFKRINDTYGHLGGDRVLARLAGILRADTRTDDVLARIGGEEFALIMHRISPEDACARLAQLRARLHRDPIRLNACTHIQVTVSIGYTVVGEQQPQPQFAPPRDPQEIVKRADDALYWIKANGRNGCIAWSELDPHYRKQRQTLLHCETRRSPCPSADNRHDGNTAHQPTLPCLGAHPQNPSTSASATNSADSND